MYARDQFVARGSNSDTNFTWDHPIYQAPAGAFNGGEPAGFTASAFFRVDMGGGNGADQIIWGNLVGNTGWALVVGPSGDLQARVGLGGSIATISYDPGKRLAQRWCYATLISEPTGSDSVLSLYVNGQAVASTNSTGGNVAPSPGSATLGYNPGQTFYGSISAVSYNTSGAGPSIPHERAFRELTRTGQLAQVGDSVNRAATDIWQVPFYNDRPVPADLWLPGAGSIPLTRVGDNVPGVFNACSNVWV